jgi:hypothetical protein
MEADTNNVTEGAVGPGVHRPLHTVPLQDGGVGVGASRVAVGDALG